MPREASPERTPGPVRRRERTEENMERLLSAAADLMARQGYDKTSIRDVGREAGFSLAGMYYYFRSKEELLYRIQDRTFGLLLAQQERLAADGGTPEERFRRLVCSHLSYLSTHRDELKVCTFELESLKGEYYAKIEKLRRRYFKLMAQLVGDLLGASGRTGVDARDIRHSTLFVFGMLNWALMWFDPRRDSPTGELGEKMVGMVLDGLRG